MLLVVAVLTDRFGIRWHGINLRFELLAAGLLVLWLLLTQRRTAAPAVGLVEWCLLSWLVVGVFSSAVFSPAPTQSLKLTLLVAGLLGLYAVTVALLRSTQAIARIALIWVLVGAGVAAIGVVEAILYVVFGWHAGMSFDGSYEGGITIIAPKVHSTLWEPNIFGSCLLTVWALAFALSRGPASPFSQMRRYLRVAMALAAAGIVLSSTRAVWVIAPLLMAAVAVIAVRRGMIGRRQLLPSLVNPSLMGIALGLGVLLVMSVSQCTTPLARAAPTSGSVTAGTPAASANPLAAPGCARDGSAFLTHFRGFFHPGKVSSFTGRANIDMLAFQGWLQRPLLGRGSGSSLYAFGPTGGGWIGNLELHILFDTGIVGLVLLLVAVITGTVRGMRALMSPVATWDTTRFVLFGLLAGGAGLLLAYQLTEGSWLGFTWVFLAILVAAGRHATGWNQAPRQTSPSA